MMNIENYENLSNEVSASLKEQALTKSREVEMNHETLEELEWHYMFIAACLPEDDYNKLREKWKAGGGYNATPWWLFVSRNTKVELKSENRLDVKNDECRKL